MSNTKESISSESSVKSLREDLIETAVRFLTHPNVVPRPLETKKNFLISKGLTENEMQEAISRSASKVPPPPPMHNAVAIPIPPSHYQVTPYVGRFEKFRQFLHTVALLGGLGYALFWVYKTYIEPFLFGKKKPRSKPVEDRVNDLENSVKTSLAEIRTEIGKSTTASVKAHEKLATFQQIKELQADLLSVKGVLLSRKQFPPASNLIADSYNSQPVTIPTWQLSATSESSRDSKKVLMPDLNSDSESSIEHIVSSESVDSKTSG